MEQLIDIDTKRRIVSVLLKRGFVITELDGHFVLGQDAFFEHEIYGIKFNDENYLKEIFRKFRIGSVQQRTLVFKRKIRPETLYKKLFIERFGTMGFETFFTEPDRSEYQYFNRLNNLAIRLLDPFVARYIKALEECGIQTEYSCDGHNDKGRSVIIGCRGDFFREVHKWLVKNLLVKKCDLKWDDECVYLKIEDGTYDSLNECAATLYKYRIEIREWLNECVGSIDVYSDTYLDDMYSQMNSNREKLRGML